MGGGKPAESGTVALIRRLEEELLLPEVRKSVTRLAALLAEEFVEIGSSGRIYDNSRSWIGCQRNNGPDHRRTYPISRRGRLRPT